MKPLIMFNSKKLLRYKPATSKIEEFVEGSQFNKVYAETDDKYC